MTIKIGLFYGSTTCYTEMAGEKIRDAINESYGSDVVSIHDISLDSIQRMSEYSYLILGIPTWDFGELQEDWESHWEEAHQLNLEGKTVALYGMGDQLGYADWFQDALGMLHDAIAPSNCTIIGYWPNEGYEFTASKALTEDKSQFLGLSLDDENQYDKSEERIAAWCEQLLISLAG